MSLPWIEKYRPTNLDQIVGNHEAINQFKIIGKTGNIPHLILTGSPGTGKTTSIICLAKTLLQDQYQDAFLELNASDQRGIDIIRTKISEFCKKKVNLPEGRHKIIFLDEVDSMTSAAQQALRRIIEIYTHSTRFTMACNTSTQIIEAIQSRCAIIRFSKIVPKDVEERLKEICDREGKTYTEEGLESIIIASNGDMRRALNSLQSVCTTFNQVTMEAVSKMISQPSHLEMKEVLSLALKHEFNTLNQKISSLISQGYSAQDIIQLFFFLVKDIEMDTVIQLKYLKEIGQTQIYLTQGGDPHLQLLALMARLCLIE